MKFFDIPLNELVSKFGTPLYIYSEKALNTNILSFLSSFNVPKLQVCYAMKANSNLQILSIMKQNGIGVDCVSIGEMRTALKVGFSSEKIRFTPTFASNDEIIFAIKHDIQISIDSMQWLEWMLINHPETPVGLRINPSVMAGAYAKTSVGHSKAKFGIGIQYLDQILDMIVNQGLKVNGLHIHSGSDILESSQYMEAVEVLLRIAPNFDALEYLDLGSGFKVSYFEGDHATDMVELGKVISTRFNQFCKEYGRPLKLIFEPGKFLVSNAGYFLVTCTGIKENGGITFAGVDSGFNHLIRPMFYGAYHTIKNISNPDGELKTYDVVGNICETDTFASERQIPEIRVGDILAFENAGAYCFSMASPYNSRPRPAEVLIMSDGHDRLIRKRETMEDIWHNQE